MLRRLLLLALLAVPLAASAREPTYITAQELDLVSILPPPIVAGSAADREQLAVVLRAQRTASPERIEQARRDADESVDTMFAAVLARFHYLAYGAAAVLLLSMAAMALLGPRPRGLAVRGIIVAAMLAVAVYSGVVVIGRINAIQREVGGLPSRLPADDVRRVRFDELHALSTRLMMLNVLGALALLYWEAGE